MVSNDTNGSGDKARVDLSSIISNAVLTLDACNERKKAGPATFRTFVKSFDSTKGRSVMIGYKYVMYNDCESTFSYRKSVDFGLQDPVIGQNYDGSESMRITSVFNTKEQIHDNNDSISIS